jgi:hypothetical protein
LNNSQTAAVVQQDYKTWKSVWMSTGMMRDLRNKKPKDMSLNSFITSLLQAGLDHVGEEEQEQESNNGVMGSVQHATKQATTPTAPTTPLSTETNRFLTKEVSVR